MKTDKHAEMLRRAMKMMVLRMTNTSGIESQK